MKFSIITVCLNAVNTIEECINSVLNQDYSDIEYIVMDGGSTDGTYETLLKYKDRIHCLCSEKDAGLYDALNKGIQKSKGDVIAILHSDDLFVSKTIISEYANAFKLYQTDGVYADVRYINPNLKILRTWKSGSYQPNAFLWGWMPPHTGLVIKKQCFKLYGMYRTDLEISADYELMLRFIQVHNISLFYMKRFAVHMRTGGKSNRSLSSRMQAHAQDLKAWRLNDLKPFWFTLMLKRFRKINQFFT